MARAFHCRPSQLYGLNDETDAWLARSIDRATWLWGSTIDALMAETKEQVAPKRSGPAKMQVPKRDERWLTRAIYGPLERSEGGAEVEQPSGPLDPYAIEDADDADNIPPHWRGQSADAIANLLPKQRGV